MKITQNHQWFRSLTALLKKELSPEDFNDADIDDSWYDSSVFFSDWIVSDGLYGVTREKWLLIMNSVEFQTEDQSIIFEKYGENPKLQELVTEVIFMILDKLLVPYLNGERARRMNRSPLKRDKVT